MLTGFRGLGFWGFRVLGLPGLGFGVFGVRACLGFGHVWGLGQFRV